MSNGAGESGHGSYSASDYAGRAHRPQFLNDLHAHFFGLGHRCLAAFDGVLDVADALIGKLNKTDYVASGRDDTRDACAPCSFRDVFLKDYCRFASRAKIRCEQLGPADRRSQRHRLQHAVAAANATTTAARFAP